MPITIVPKADVATDLEWEVAKVEEFKAIPNKTLTGTYNEISTSSNITYSGSNGQWGFYNKILETFASTANDWKAENWNLLQTELSASFTALETPSYGNVVSTTRDQILTGNTGGTITITGNGTSAVNITADRGGLYTDNTLSGRADGLTGTSITNESFEIGKQTFTATTQNGRESIDTLTVAVNDVLLVVFENVEADSTSVLLNAVSGATTVTDAHSGSGSERLALLITANATTLNVDIRDTRTSAWTPISFGRYRVINLTQEGDLGLSLVDALLKYNNHFDFIGSATHNVLVSGTNGKQEVKENYVIPKDPAGVASEWLVKDGQQFLRMKHKSFVLNGDMGWTNFGTLTTTAYAQLNTFISDNNIVQFVNLSGSGLNNDTQFPVLIGADDIERLSPQGGVFFIVINKSRLSTLTLEGFKEYLNSNPIHAFFRLTSDAYVDIPVKHLASIPEGTITNNSQILPSSLTYTYPTNKAGERESSQIAQNQITTVESKSYGSKYTYDTDGNLIASRGFGDNTDYYYDNDANNTAIITPTESYFYSYDENGNASEVIVNE